MELRANYAHHLADIMKIALNALPIPEKLNVLSAQPTQPIQLNISSEIICSDVFEIVKQILLMELHIMEIVLLLFLNVLLKLIVL